ILAVYLPVWSFWLTVVAFKNIPNELKGASTSEILRKIFKPRIGALIAAMMPTFDIWLAACLLYRDPWHLGFNMIQYLYLAPSFTNVLNVYAFCNLHHVSWGTKGSHKADGLSSVWSKKTKDADPAFVKDSTRNTEDLDPAFKDTAARALTKLQTKDEIGKPTMADGNETLGTRLVAFWMLSNAGLAVAILNLNGLGSGNKETDKGLSTRPHDI
ncbi:class III chitin synthase, partial [Lentinus tigrinus ALCF2SS1-6]